MANLMHLGDRNPSTLESIGQKVKDVVGIGMALKDIYGLGRLAYSGFTAAAPYLETLMAVGL
jgi:hypothetical protein